MPGVLPPVQGEVGARLEFFHIPFQHLDVAGNSGMLFPVLGLVEQLFQPIKGYLPEIRWSFVCGDLADNEDTPIVGYFHVIFVMEPAIVSAGR